jgi:hypothetical protein
MRECAAIAEIEAGENAENSVVRLLRSGRLMFRETLGKQHSHAREQQDSNEAVSERHTHALDHRDFLIVYVIVLPLSSIFNEENILSAVRFPEFHYGSDASHSEGSRFVRVSINNIFGSLFPKI